MKHLFSNRPALRRIVKGTATVGAAVIAAALPLGLPLPLGIAAVCLLVLVLAAVGLRDVAELRRLRRDIAERASAAGLLHGLLRSSSPETPIEVEDHEPRIQALHDAFDSGFPDTALKMAKAVAADGTVPFGVRLDLMRAMLDRHITERERAQIETRRTFDIVIVADVASAGNAAEAAIAEIEACRELGFNVGLVHHPDFARGPERPLLPAAQRLVDDGAIALIAPYETVECGLAIVRTPRAFARPLEARPWFEARQTVVIADESPFRYYGPEGPHDALWDLATVERHLESWFGVHTWHATSYIVHDTLVEHHAETKGLDLAFNLWGDTIDIEQWRIGRRRKRDGRIRLGRIGGGDERSWPGDRQTLLECYPPGDRFQVQVLGDGAVPARVLGELPSNWTTHPEDAMSAKAFLEAIDLMVYFGPSDGVEAFAREPLVAMAAGIPVIMDRRFASVYGPAAVYCEPHRVAAAAQRLAAGEDVYAAQQSIAWSFLSDRFSSKTLSERLSMHGVVAGPEA